MKTILILMTVGLQASDFPSPKWKLAFEENFSEPFNAQTQPWMKDPMGKKSPWNPGPLGDDGQFFHIMGGEAFKNQLKTFDIYRKRIPLGKEGWLTLELAARDADKDGRPDQPPNFLTKEIPGAGIIGFLDEPHYQGGIILRNTKALPPAYRIEYDLIFSEFGGRRYDTWDYAGRLNGYGAEGPKTIHPWSWGSDPWAAAPLEKWPPVRDGNGFYYLVIVDYPNPAPHNNVFIHTRRKVVMDSYFHRSAAFKVCDPLNKKFYLGNNTLNAFFAIPGSKLETKAIVASECLGQDGGGLEAPLSGSVELIPEAMPGKSYHFAVERDANGYVLEFSGPFRFVGEKTYRYRRDFVQDGVPIWHYNQHSKEYNGAFDQSWEYQGPYGHYREQSWPKKSAYPDYFIIGDPHINYYEGTAAIDNIKLYIQ